MSTAGTASILNALIRYKIFEIWKKEKIEILNFSGISNLNPKLCDPLAIAYMINSGFNCVADVYLIEKNDPQCPVFLENYSGILGQFFPFEIEFLKKSNLLISQGDSYLGMKDINLFTTVEHLHYCIKEHHNLLF